MTTPTASIPFTSLPTIGADMEGGTYAGITTHKDGSNHAVVLLPGWTPETLTWPEAMNWAQQQGGELPNRQIAATLFSNTKLRKGWYWTSETRDEAHHFAWMFYSGDFHVNEELKTYEEGCAIAVRLIPLTTSPLSPPTVYVEKATKSFVTLEAVNAKRTELADLIKKQQFQDATTETIDVEQITITLQPGERYAGPVIDEQGHLKHHLVLLAQRPTGNLAWQPAMDWATSVGGTLPNCQENMLLMSNCRPHMDPVGHWSNESHQNIPTIAWSFYFDNNVQLFHDKSYELSAVAVRRV